MGLWKIAIGLLIGAALTESGRKTLKDITKRLITIGQSAADKSASALDELKAKTTELIEEVKTEEKASSARAKKS
jgi:hypothetical protein